MRAIRIHQVGGPEALRYEEFELPPPGPGEARIRHHAIGLNYLDVYNRTGLYPNATPFTPGSEGAGDVVAVGRGVKTFKEGDRVAYVARGGAYAEEANIDVKFLAKLPK